MLPFRILLLPVLLVFCVKATAQQSITGRIIDGSFRAVEGAVVSVHQLPDSTLLKTELSDSGGRFAVSVAEQGSYLLRVTALGYASYEGIIMTGNQLQNITLQGQNQMLKGVNVTARKPLIERRPDRTIFNVESSTAAAGSDAFEMLRKAPGVRVNRSDISITGKNTVSVMINDRLTQLSGDELIALLKSIPAEELSRIEVITTPPAKYDAEGSTGLINIVTKKNRKDGFNGNVNLSYNQRTEGTKGLTGQFNWRKGALNVFGNGNAYNGYLQPLQRTITYYPDARMEMDNSLRTQNVFNRLNIGADYSLNDKMVLGIVGTLGNGGWSYRADELQTTRAYNAHTGALDSTLITAGHNTDRGWRKVLNLNWEWKIDSTGKKLSADVDVFSRIGDRTRDFTTAQYLPDGTPTGLQADNKTGGRQDVNIRSIKLDAVWPWRKTQLSFGAKASIIHNISDNLFTYRQGSEYLNDTAKTNSFNYKEATQAVYLSAQRSMGKWEAQAGLRGEYTQTVGFSPTLSSEVRNAYFQIFPTAYVQYSANENHVLNLNYSRRIERPSFWVMNPFRAYFTALSYHEGNPFLQPSFTHNLELSYTLNSSYTFSLFTNQQRNMSMTVPVLDEATHSYHFTQVNTGVMRSFGANLQTTLKPVKAWECVLGASGFSRRFESNYYGGPAAYRQLSFSIETENSISFNKAQTIMAELSASYNSPQQTDFDNQRANGEVSTGIRWLLLQKTLTLTLQAEDLFRTDRWQVTNSANGTVQDHYYDQQQVRLTAGWKFGNTAVKARRERAAGAEEARRAQ